MKIRATFALLGLFLFSPAWASYAPVDTGDGYAAEQAADGGGGYEDDYYDELARENTVIEATKPKPHQVAKRAHRKLRRTHQVVRTVVDPEPTVDAE